MDIILEKLGANMDTAVLVSWFKSEGDFVRAGETIAEVATDKVNQEIVSPVDGILVKQCFQEDDDVPVGEVLAVIQEQASVQETPAVEADAPQAEQANVPGGAQVYQLTRIERISGERMKQSLQTTAQLTLTREVDVTEALRRLRELETVSGARITFTALLIGAVTRSLLEHPRLYGKLEGDRIVIPDTVDMNVAVATEQGLLVPLMKNLNHQSVREIAEKLNDMASRARASRLRLDELGMGGFTLTNLGASGVDTFTPILYPGQIGILGVGRILPKPWVVEGSIEARSIVTLSLTWDHQALDGYPAAQFMDTLAERLEKPDWVG